MSEYMFIAVDGYSIGYMIPYCQHILDKYTIPYYQGG